MTFQRGLKKLFFGMVVLAVAAWSHAADYKIILVETMPVPVVLDHCHWFVTQLEELGYHKGAIMDLVTLKAQGDRKRARLLLERELKKGRPDIVATSATLASQVAAELLEDTDIPQVFFTVSDPVGAGLVEKIGEPTGKNITGKVHMIERATRIHVVMNLMTDYKKDGRLRVGFVHSSYPSSKGDLRELMSKKSYGNKLVFISHEVAYRQMPQGRDDMLEDVKKAITILEDSVDCWWEPSGPLGELPEYTKLLLSHSRHPIVMGTKLDSVKQGALLHLTPGVEATGREAALLADAVLKGSDPGSIPVTPPTKVDLGINLSTALKMQIVVPSEVMSLAGENVFR